MLTRALFFALCAARLSAGEVLLSGRVVQAGTSTGIPGARVTLLRTQPTGAMIPRDWQSTPIPGFAALTGPDGSFRFTVSAPASYLPLAWAPGHLSTAPEFDLARILTLKDTQPPAPLLLELERESWISGRILTPADAPAPAGLLVTARPLPGPGLRVTARTGVGGAYRLGPLRSGDYLLSVQPQSPLAVEPAAPEPPEPGRILVETWYPGAAEPALAQPLRLLPGAALEKLDLRQQTAREAHLQLALHGPAGQPLQLQLFADLSRGRSLEHDRLLTRPARDGESLLLRGLAPGPVALCLATTTAPLHAACETLTLVPGARPRLTLAAQPAATLAVRLLSAEKDQPLPTQGSLLVAVTPAGRPKLDSEAPPALIRFSDPSVEIPNLFAGAYDLSLPGLPKGWALTALSLNGAPLPGLRLPATAGALRQEVELLLARTGSLRVQLDRSRAQVWLVLFPENAPPETRIRRALARRTSPQGQAEFPDLAPGRYRLLAFSSTFPSFDSLPLPATLEGAAAVLIEPARAAAVELSAP